MSSLTRRMSRTAKRIGYKRSLGSKVGVHSLNAKDKIARELREALRASRRGNEYKGVTNLPEVQHRQD